MDDVGTRYFLELDKVRKAYRTKGSFIGGHGREVIALNGISLGISKGEIFGLVGESGSGKTTLGRLIVRLGEKDAGKIFLDGVEITGLKGKPLKDFRRRVQMIFQDPYQSLNPQFSILDTVSEPLIIHKIGNEEARQALVLQVMKSVGLSPPDDYLHRHPHQLSGGQRQRVAIARAMIMKPELVVADEPTSMLDASISSQIFNILLEMRETLNVTLLFITHSLAAARYLCDRIAVMYRGNLMEVGPAEEVISHPRHPYTQALIDAIPKFGHCGALKRYGTILRAGRKAFERGGCPFFNRCKPAHPVTCRQEVPPLAEVNRFHWVACLYQGPRAETRTQGSG